MNHLGSHASRSPETKQKSVLRVFIDKCITTFEYNTCGKWNEGLLQIRKVGLKENGVAIQLYRASGLKKPRF